MDTSADLTLPSLDVRLIARRAALPAAVAAVAAGALIVAGGPLETFAHALRRAVDADPRWVAAAAGFELLSFAGYVALLWLVAGRATSRMGIRESVEVTLGGAAATRLLPTAGVGGAALTLWALRRTGMGARAAGRTLLTFLVLLYAVFLGSIAVAGTLLAVEGEGPLALTALPAAAAAPASRSRWALGLRLPARGARARVRARRATARRGRRATRSGFVRVARRAPARRRRLVGVRRGRPGRDAPRVRRRAVAAGRSCSPTSSARPATRCRSRAP